MNPAQIQATPMDVSRASASPPCALFVVLLLLGVIQFCARPAIAASGTTPPDVLFIVVDDLNDWITLLDSRAPIRTPNLERLADRGMLFTRAYCASPACNPSRVAVLTGKRPSTTGVYGNKSDWRAALPNTPTLMQQFKAAGYRVEGAGKIFHHHFGNAMHDDASFDAFRPMPNPPDAPMPDKKLNRLPDFGSANTDWGVWPPEESAAVDHQTIDYCIDRLKQARDKPLFLAAGLFRPHMPFFAPQKYFNEYPIDDVVLPRLVDDDLNDIPTGGKTLWKKKRWFWDGMQAADVKCPGSYRNAVRAYQACASFADAQIGRLLDALDASGQANNTVVILWSDHGYHLGEKQHWEKFALWEKTCHVPYIIVAPGITKPGSRCAATVDLMSVFPTLIELCSLPAVDGLNGQSLLPLLRDPTAKAARPALTTYLRGNHAVRSDRWRYIRYRDGSEELYDHRDDPHELNNVASHPDNVAILRAHRRWLPESNAPQVTDWRPQIRHSSSTPSGN